MINGKTVTAIIQARMGSSRFPGKVLEVIFDNNKIRKHVLGFLCDGLNRSEFIDNIVVATTTSEKDDIIEKFDIKAWLAEDYMYRPVRIEEIVYTNNIPKVKRTSHISYVYHNGIWFPQKKEINTYADRTDNKEWLLTHRGFWSVNGDFQLNVALPDSLFEYEYR